MNPDIENARNEYQTATKTAGDLAAGSYNVEGAIKNKLMDAYEYNKDLVQPLDKATSSYLTAPSDARVKYQDIFNPFRREQLVSQYTQNQAIPMLSLSNILGLRQGSIADQINAGVGGYQAKVASAQNQAALAQQNYENLLNEYKLSAGANAGANSRNSAIEYINSLFPDSGSTTGTNQQNISLDNFLEDDGTPENPAQSWGDWAVNSISNRPENLTKATRALEILGSLYPSTAPITMGVGIARNTNNVLSKLLNRGQ